MASGCTVLASDTAPVREVVQDGVHGVLLPFFDVHAWAQAILALLDQPDKQAALGAAARAHVVANYDLKTVCLPQQLAWVQALMAR